LMAFAPREKKKEGEGEGKEKPSAGGPQIEKDEELPTEGGKKDT